MPDNKLPLITQTVERATAFVFGSPLLTNIHRAVVAEAIVASALEPEWEWCAGDYSAFDFRHVSGARLEVKQSASLQSWNRHTLKPSKCSFDIAERTGRWEDVDRWISERGRNADVYLFCHHPIVSSEADHRDASQWRFFPVKAADLPPGQKKMGLNAVKLLSSECNFQSLADRLRLLI